MKKTCIITDTNTGLTHEEAGQLGIKLISMPFTIAGKNHLEGITCSYGEFFERLNSGAEVSTSQPSPDAVISAWEEALEEYESVIYIPMSSALSGSCSTATALAQDYDGRVQVVDNKRVSVPQIFSVEDAILLADYGLDAKQIKEILDKEACTQSTYVTVNTLELLKKSGRVTKTAAAIGTVLGLKPVLQIQGEKLDSFKKARGMDKAKSIMIDAVKDDIATRFKGDRISLAVAYSGDKDNGLAWQQEVAYAFPGYEVVCYQLPISLCCHLGDGVLGIAVAKTMLGQKC